MHLGCYLGVHSCCPSFADGPEYPHQHSYLPSSTTAEVGPLAASLGVLPSGCHPCLLPWTEYCLVLWSLWQPRESHHRESFLCCAWRMIWLTVEKQQQKTRNCFTFGKVTWSLSVQHIIYTNAIMDSVWDVIILAG